MRGKHIELFLVDGMPGGITTAEIVGWTGHVLAGPRADLADILKRDEARRNGVYLLLGDEDSGAGKIQAYIGKTENFVQRFNRHKLQKAFWDRAVLITAKDDAFNEGHWSHLEARLVEIARQTKRSDLTNDNNPQTRKLSEAQASDVEAFLEQLRTVLPVLGVNILRGRTATPTPAAEAEESPVFTLTNARARVQAQAQLIGGEFTVLEGSHVVAAWTGVGKAESTQRSYASYRAQHERLLADGSIVIEQDHGVTTRDIPFTSPSLAGAVLLGRSCNGRNEWIYPGGTYGQWEERDLHAAVDTGEITP